MEPYRREFEEVMQFESWSAVVEAEKYKDTLGKIIFAIVQAKWDGITQKSAADQTDLIKDLLRTDPWMLA